MVCIDCAKREGERESELARTIELFMAKCAKRLFIRTKLLCMCVCVFQFWTEMIFWQKINQTCPVHIRFLSLACLHRIAQYGRPPTCLFITHNVHFPNFSYSNFGYTRNTRPNKENSSERASERENRMTGTKRIHIGIAATPVQLNFLPSCLCCSWRQPAAAAAAATAVTRERSVSESEWVQVVCSLRFVSFGCFVVHYIKYIFT